MWSLEISGEEYWIGCKRRIIYSTSLVLREGHLFKLESDRVEEQRTNIMTPVSLCFLWFSSSPFLEYDCRSVSWMTIHFRKRTLPRFFPKFEGNKETHVFEELFIAKWNKIDSFKKLGIILKLYEKLIFSYGGRHSLDNRSRNSLISQLFQ